MQKESKKNGAAIAHKRKERQITSKKKMKVVMALPPASERGKVDEAVWERFRKSKIPTQEEQWKEFQKSAKEAQKAKRGFVQKKETLKTFRENSSTKGISAEMIEKISIFPTRPTSEPLTNQKPMKIPSKPTDRHKEK